MLDHFILNQIALFCGVIATMTIDSEKQDALEHNEIHHEHQRADTDISSIAPEEDGKVTLKSKLAVLSLILMYESYLFTLVM